MKEAFLLSERAPWAIDNCIREIRDLPKDKAFLVTIEEKTPKRSTQQNNYYWKCISILGDHFGYTREEMHEELAARWLGLIERKTVGGHVIIEPRSTTTLTIKEFSEYLDRIIALGLQHEVILPKPDHYGYKI